MNLNDALKRITEVMRRKHLALATEQSYRAWLQRYCEFVVKLPAHLPREQKVEHFLPRWPERMWRPASGSKGLLGTSFYGGVIISG